MKKILFILSFISFTSAAQKPWRTLTFNNNFGVSATREPFNQFSTNLYYEINPKVYITNWNGFNYFFQGQGNSWISSQALAMRKFDKLAVGGGFQYGVASQSDFMFRDKAIYLIGSVTYQFKL